VGAISAHKGHFDILAAALLLRSRPIRFCFAGPLHPGGEGEHVRRRVQELGLDAAVSFAGPVGTRRKWDLLAEADVFLLPSSAEGMPNSVLEAMAAGLPVIASPVGSVPEMLGAGQGGRLVAPGDFDRLAEALIELQENPELRRSLGQWNRTRVDASYRMDRVLAQLDGLYQRPCLAAAAPAWIEKVS
jgi:glycosyltransferase involved in cell wall biosynthesis